MSCLLYVECSPRKDRSVSIAICRAFLDAYRAAHPGDEVRTLDLWSLDLPEFDGAALSAKYAGLSGTPLSSAQQHAWERVRELAAPLLAADKLLFGVPLWNFGIPYKLKHYIDVVSQKDVLFTFDGKGFGGLLAGRKAAVVYARGLDYLSPGTLTPARVFDLQRPYMDMWLKFVGVDDVQAIVVERTLLEGDDGDWRQRAAEQARMVARDF